MQNQQIVSKIFQLENELKLIKTQLQKTAGSKPAANLWAKINHLDFEIDKVKGAIFDFDIAKFVAKSDIASWK